MRKAYTVYFELFGKKMKTDVVADSEEGAMQEIRNRVKFYKVSEIPIKQQSELSEVADFLRKIVDGDFSSL